MPNRFCAICGRDIQDDAPHFGMCIICYLKENPLFELPEKFSFKTCIDCGSYSKREQWKLAGENEILSVIEEAIYNFLLKQYLKKGNIEFEIFIDEETIIYSSKDLINSVEAVINGFLISDNNIRHQQTIKVSLNYELCKNCTNIRGGIYFISTIQLRVRDERYFNTIKNVLEDIQRYVEKSFEKDPKQYIAKIEDEKNGVDLFLSTNELMNHIISFLKGNYNFLLKRSKKLVGRDAQRGKGIYRLKSLIKFLPFNRNDTVKMNDMTYIVETISKNRVVLRSEVGTKLIKNYSYFFNDKIIIE